MMDNSIKYLYVGILFFLFLVSFVILIVYYYQEPELEFNIKKDISYDDISFTYKRVRDIEYLDSMSGSLGSVELKNEGYFDRKMYIPNLLICFNYSEGVVYDEIFTGITVRFDSEGYMVSDDLIVPIDVDYRPSYLKAEDLWKYDVNGFVVYEIPRRKRNPIGRTYINKVDCRNAGNFYNEIAFIKKE